MAKFRNRFNMPRSTGAEVFTEESECDSLGYRSISQMVNDFVEAGVRLDSIRRGEQYDFSPDASASLDLDKIDVPLSRRPGLDLVDAADIADNAKIYAAAVASGQINGQDDSVDDEDDDEPLPKPKKKAKKKTTSKAIQEPALAGETVPEELD